MLAMLMRRLALVGCLCLALIAVLRWIDPPEPPLLIKDKTAIELDGSDSPEFVQALMPELPALAHPSPYLVDPSTLVRVLCSNETAGTAIYLGSGRYVTAAHVVLSEKLAEKPPLCLIAGQIVHIDDADRTHDYALIHAAHYPPFHATISCERLNEGEIYFASGFAEGNAWPVTTRIRGTAVHDSDDGTAEIHGSLINGMSGGSVSDLDGVTHAITDWHDEDSIPNGGVVDLADTPLCKKGNKP